MPLDSAPSPFYVHHVRLTEDEDLSIRDRMGNLGRDKVETFLRSKSEEEVTAPDSRLEGVPGPPVSVDAN